MLADFRKTIFPTEDEIKRQGEFLDIILNEDRAFWLSKGLTESEYVLLKELESQECSELRSVQSYATRRSLLEGDLITMKQVRADIKRWRNRKALG